MHRMFAVVALLGLVGCGDKKEAPASSGDEAQKASSTAGVDAPKDKNSQEFVRNLIDHPVHNFSPSDTSGLKFTYVTLTFAADNTWMALARLGEGDDSMDCKEMGTWTMDPAESATVATMEWKLTKSTCAGRPQANIIRAKVNQTSAADYNIQIR